MSTSTGSPDLVLRRYFLSQMSAEAGCIGITGASGPGWFDSFFTARSVLLPVLIPS